MIVRLDADPSLPCEWLDEISIRAAVSGGGSAYDLQYAFYWLTCEHPAPKPDGISNDVWERSVSRTDGWRAVHDCLMDQAGFTGLHNTYDPGYEKNAKTVMLPQNIKDAITEMYVDWQLRK